MDGKILIKTWKTRTKNETEKNRSITEHIKTFNDAVCELGNEHPFVIDWYLCCTIHEIEAYLRLRIICAALNEGWEPQFTQSECRWQPWFRLCTEIELAEKSDKWKADRHLIMIGDKYQSEFAGLAFEFSSRTAFGSRLCLKSEALATYCGKQFIDIWADFLLINHRRRG